MVKVIHVDDDGVQVAAIELDDFTIEILYSGIADLLKNAARGRPDQASPVALSREALQRRSRILNRIHA
jgi:hypothetical protein